MICYWHFAIFPAVAVAVAVALVVSFLSLSFYVVSVPLSIAKHDLAITNNI